MIFRRNTDLHDATFTQALVLREKLNTTIRVVANVAIRHFSTLTDEQQREALAKHGDDLLRVQRGRPPVPLNVADGDSPKV